MGFTRTLQGFAVLNLAGAAAILALATRCEPPSEKPRPVLAPLSARALGALLFATGLLGIGLEVLGVRMLRLVLDDTVFTFACVLAVYLLGTATGAALAKRCLARVPLDRRLARLLAGTGVTCALSGWALVAAPGMYPGLRAGLGASPGARALADVLVSASVFLAPSLLMGATFASLAEAARDRWGSVGRAVAWNTLGGMLAPLMVGAGLFPLLGAKGTLAGLVIGYGLLPPGRRMWPELALVGVGLLLVITLPDARLLTLQPGERLRAYREGVSDSVAVVETAAGHRTLRLNNRFTMGGTASANAERRQAHLPLLLHPGPRRALFLGSGTGITAAAAAAHPGLVVDSVELVPDVVRLMPEFAPENYAEPGRVRQYVADARRFMRLTPNRYDVIVADLFHPARDGAGALYTREHYHAIRRRIAPGGVFCQWVPLYQVDLETLGLITASVKDAFPCVRAFLLRPTVDTPAVGLIATMESVRYPADWFQRRVTSPALREQLGPLGLTDTLQLLGGYLGEAGEFPTAEAPDTDDRQLVNFRSARLLRAPAPPGLQHAHGSPGAVHDRTGTDPGGTGERGRDVDRVRGPKSEVRGTPATRESGAGTSIESEVRSPKPEAPRDPGERGWDLLAVAGLLRGAQPVSRRSPAGSRGGPRPGPGRVYCQRRAQQRLYHRLCPRRDPGGARLPR